MGAHSGAFNLWASAQTIMRARKQEVSCLPTPSSHHQWRASQRGQQAGALAARRRRRRRAG